MAPAPPKFTILKRPSASPGASAASLVNAVPSPFDEDQPPTSSNPSSPLATNETGQNNSNSRERRPQVKSLEQRKQEYAEARLRILGDAKFSDDDDDEGVRVGDRPAPYSSTASSMGPGKAAQQNRNGGGGSGGGPGGIRYSNHHNNSNNNNNFNYMNNKSGPPASQYGASRPPPPPAMFNPNVPPPRYEPMRVPRGPDGSVGFQSRR